MSGEDYEEGEFFDPPVDPEDLDDTPFPNVIQPTYTEQEDPGGMSQAGTASESDEGMYQPPKPVPEPEQEFRPGGR